MWSCDPEEVTEHDFAKSKCTGGCFCSAQKGTSPGLRLPEQDRWGSDVGRESIWALGCVLVCFAYTLT